jgi:hypothetical protein
MTDRGIEWLKSRLGEIQKQTDEYRTKDAFRDQEFAKAYHESGCTQQEIGEAFGCKRRIVGYRLAFGRFLEWCGTTCATLPLRTLTEGRFRECWSETTGYGEEPRFRNVNDGRANDRWHGAGIKRGNNRREDMPCPSRRC